MLGPGLGTAELIVIAVIALIVVGPKDLPVLLRKLGRFMGKVRAMATDFRASFDEMARQSELDELRKEVEALRTGQISDKWLEPARTAMDDIDSSVRAGSAARPFAPAEPETMPKDSLEGMLPLRDAAEFVGAEPNNSAHPGEGRDPDHALNGSQAGTEPMNSDLGPGLRRDERVGGGEPRASRPFAPAELAPEREQA